MNENMKRDRIKGFLDVDGRKIVNELGEEIVLTGWGLGNWLLCEGYMWLSGGSERFDRPRRIEAVVEELAGKEYAASFWQQFRNNYVTEEDIRYMAELGYNSVRIPINARLFLEEGPGIIWVEEGFERLTQCIDWCEKYKLYAFIDLHGAPGGQTGANIDDCIDDMPRLFIDQDCFDKGIELWKEIARRYKDRWIVAGYDLLNEPIRPKRYENDKDLDYLIPRLREFYEKTIEEIRKIDTKHLISLEGQHWATTTDIFDKSYDSKMILHFHRYACIPDKSCYEQFIKVAEEINCPLWLGETGENSIEWFTAMYPLAADLGIGYNIWPWKKMSCKNSPLSVNKPDNWDKIIGYSKGESHPGYEEARVILNRYLENMKLENCTINHKVSQSVLRQPGSIIRGTDFDEFPGKGVSYSGLREGNPDLEKFAYRVGTGMGVVEKTPEREKSFIFDSGWERFVLSLMEKEFATYTLHDIVKETEVVLKGYCLEDSIFCIYNNNELIEEIKVAPNHMEDILASIKIGVSDKAVIKVEVVKGIIELSTVITE